MAGVGEEAGPSSAPSTPRNTCRSGVAVLRLISPTPSTKQKEKPSPGAAPTPTWAVHSVVFSSPMAQGGHGVGEVALQSQLDSGSDPGLLVHPGTHSLCHLFF